jgi:ketosteroid isomerase-like protein
MKIRLLLSLAGLAVGFAFPTLAQEQNTVDPEIRQQIEAAHMKYEEAHNKHDAAAVSALFTQDAVEVWSRWSEGGLASGREAIEKRYEIDLASGSDLSGEVVQMYPIGNDVCVIIKYTAQHHHHGYAATIYVRDADEWKIRMVYVN